MLHHLARSRFHPSRWHRARHDSRIQAVNGFLRVLVSIVREVLVLQAGIGSRIPTTPYLGLSGEDGQCIDAPHEYLNDQP
jgi:hypothetical protein